MTKEGIRTEKKSMIKDSMDELIPSGVSFSYLVSFEVLNTPFIFTAASHDGHGVNQSMTCFSKPKQNKMVEHRIESIDYLNVPTMGKNEQGTLEFYRRRRHHLPAIKKS